MATPGIVEADGTVRLSTALPQWTGLRLGERLGRSFRCPVLVENDANAAAVAEHWKGAATDSDDIVLVLAGLSPGAGSLIGGKLHRGYGGAAGEIGALHLLGREVTPEKLLSTTSEPLHPLDEQAVAEVFAQARGGDERARAAVDRFLRRLVHDVAALVLALDPELVVVGGWAAGLDGVLEPLRRELAATVAAAKGDPVPPGPGRRGDGRAAAGAGPCGGAALRGGGTPRPAAEVSRPGCADRRGGSPRRRSRRR
ncbi:N-acetyl-D-glucosamine kinase [Streptomyces fumanus]